MTIKQLQKAIQRSIDAGLGDTEVFVQKADKSDFANGEYQLEFRVNHYDDGIAIIVYTRVDESTK